MTRDSIKNLADLGALKDSFPPGEKAKPSTPNDEIQENNTETVGKPAKENIPLERQSETVENGLGLNPEDADLFKRLIQLLNQNLFKQDPEMKWNKKFLLEPNSGNSKKYWEIRNLIRDSLGRDVSYELNRWLGEYKSDGEIGRIYNQILLRGYKSQCVRWLKSLSPEEMKYGPKNQTPAEKRNFRLEQARESATKAGLRLEDVAKEFNLTHLLNV